MDLLEILPWGREEAEQEKEFLSEAWLSTPMLEEEYNNRKTSVDNDLEEYDGTITPEEEHNEDAAKVTSETDVAFIKWMEMNDMELAMYQQNAIEHDLAKDYVEAGDWDGSNSGLSDPTQELLQEFETVCEGYHGTLTPPHSRTPSPPPTTNIQYIPHINVQPVIQPEATPVTYPIDLAQELALLDELVRIRAEALENATPTVQSKSIPTIPAQTSTVEMPVSSSNIQIPMQAPTTLVETSDIVEVIVPDSIPHIKVEIVSPSMSPASLQVVPASSEASPSPSYYISPNSVASSTPTSPRPNTPTSSSCGDGEELSDPEWVPTKTVPRRLRAKPYSRSSRATNSGYSSSERSELSPGPSTYQGRRGSRVKGLGGSDNRKERKKEQNKNAATRYRQKKKAEAEVVASEEKQLEDKNDSLRAKAAELAKEVSYLKKLMKEMFKARGVL